MVHIVRHYRFGRENPGPDSVSRLPVSRLSLEETPDDFRHAFGCICIYVSHEPQGIDKAIFYFAGRKGEDVQKFWQVSLLNPIQWSLQSIDLQVCPQRIPIFGYFRVFKEYPQDKRDKSQLGNLVGNFLIGICLTLPNLGFLWVFFKYPKISKNGNTLFFPMSKAHWTSYLFRINKFCQRS